MIAVLLMVFAAVLGATFVTVVAANLNQTARSSNKSSARRAVESGVRFVRFKLQSEGLRWRPKTDAPPPQPDEASFPFYYSDFDRSQGWTTSGVAENDDRFHSDGFVRYPDPRALQNGALPFMLKVEKIADGETDNPNNRRTGDLRFTVVGRSSDNDFAFEKRVLYASGQRHNPLVSALRTVSNWDFANQTVPFAQIMTVSGTSLTLGKGRGNFPVGGNVYVTIGDPLSNRGLRGAVVESFNSSTRILKLAASVAPAPQVGERVEMAAALGAPPFLDFNNNGVFETTRENISFDFGAANGGNCSGGVRANGGLLWFGDVRALQLRAAQNASSSAGAATIRASGGVQLMPAPSAPTAVPAVTVAGEYSNNGSTRALPNATLVASNDANFPGAWAGMSAGDKAQLVDDGWNRLSDVPSPTRQVAPFAPPDIAAGGAQNRYRQLSQYSKPLATGDPSSAALYGYGEGIYLNNPQDRERIGTGSSLREMTQDELRRLWTSHIVPSPPAYLRLGTPAGAGRTVANRSLEEQHLRGWVGPDEFRARGALVELNADSTISITLDSRDDTATYNLGAAPHKGWRDARGNLLGHATSGGVYRQTFAWPQNGVLFAEGNIRIRGQATNPPRSLTVVAMNNIYIEGSLGAGTRKIALLARRNVVLNPTRVLERVDEQTLLRTKITATTTKPAYSMDVYDASAFQPGDWIYVNSQDVCIQSVDLPNNRLRLLDSTPITSTQAALVAVRTKGDPVNDSGEPYTRYNRLDRFSQSLQRRFVLPAGAPGEVRIALRHSAERRAAVRVPYLDGLGAPATALLGFKIAPNMRTSLIHSNNKNLVVSDSANPLDSWYVVRPTSPMMRATDYHINWLAGPAPASTAANTTPLPAPVIGVLRNRMTPGWRYADPATPLIFNDYGRNSNIVGHLQLPPFYFLAAIGNRIDATSSGIWPWRPDVKRLGFYDIPMANSVVTALNGSFSNETTGALRSDIWDDALNDYERVGQFGFNPIHGAALPDTASTDQTEDVVTSDQSFYVGYTTASSGNPSVPQSFTLDNRVLDGARSGSNSLALRMNHRLVDGVYHVKDYFNATTGEGHVPFYHLSRIKLENAGLNDAHQVETLAPAQTLDVHAFVYAQEGSWIVIPNDWYDAAVRNGADLDRDGTVSRGEQIAAYRYHRNNYRLQFVGAIAENQTAIVHPSGTIGGSVADWTDKAATISLDATSFSGPNASDAFMDNLSTRNNNFGSISYAFDDEIERGLFDDDAGLHFPIAPETAF